MPRTIRGGVVSPGRRRPDTSFLAEQPAHFRVGEAGRTAGCLVIGGLEAWGFILRYQLRIDPKGVYTALRAQMLEPAVADGDVSDLVVQDDVEDLHGTNVARTGELVLNQWRGVQPARFQGAWHQGHAREDVFAGFLAHGPQTVVRIEIAVVVIEGEQVLAQEGE